MSVLMTLRMRGDANRLESWADSHREAMAHIVEQAEQHGMLAHRFYADGSGNIMVVDEWPDEASFQAFFGATQSELQPMMEAARAQGEPEVSFWRELRTHDRYGWGAEQALT